MGVVKEKEMTANTFDFFFFFFLFHKNGTQLNCALQTHACLSQRESLDNEAGDCFLKSCGGHTATTDM